MAVCAHAQGTHNREREPGRAEEEAVGDNNRRDTGESDAQVQEELQQHSTRRLRVPAVRPDLRSERRERISKPNGGHAQILWSGGDTSGSFVKSTW